ncbi:beta/gamma crystallin-related protein [Janthinobacterium psychrotolerans]|uniref:Beta/Gamma crystallin n=1 Tax=Janthinobacterium psychrotolerans TaxID=1747903 RepID=A0A1A7C4P8_9BURK|nr:beta/gamma crystallin-related protein [Janthinobacterium psychrotolerans]OBV39288.1 Beta/Gamma crystallin [Janthinobacterium psychrotolerans]
MLKPIKHALLCTTALFATGAAQAGEMTLFQDDGFRGRSVHVRSDVSNLSQLGFNDKTSSIIVRSGNWEVCKDANFRNSCRVLQPGRYASMPGMNDAISSVREVRRGGGGGWHDGGHGGNHPGRPGNSGAVLLFPDAGMRGQPVRLDGEVRDLNRYRFNDRAQSIVINYGRWELCADANFRGRCVVMGPGNYHRLDGGLERRISSLRRVR